jgi:hypothetical protein
MTAVIAICVCGSPLDARQRRDFPLLGFDIDRLDRDQLIAIERQRDEIAPEHLGAVLVPDRRKTGCRS